jgi:hypothetical protein
MKTEFKYKASVFQDVFELLKVDVADEICNDPAISKVKIVETGGIEDHAAMAFFIRRALEKIVGEKNNSVLYGRDINPSFVLREWYEIEDMITARTMTEPSVTEPSIELMDMWMNDGMCEADCPHRCLVELDGTCPHGNKSWFIVLGLI